MLTGNNRFHENEAVLLRSQNHLDLVSTHQILKTVHLVRDFDSLELVRSVGKQVHLVGVLIGVFDVENVITVSLSPFIFAVLTHAVTTEQVRVGVKRLSIGHGIIEVAFCLRIYCLEANELFLSWSQVSHDFKVAFRIDLGGSTTFNEQLLVLDTESDGNLKVQLRFGIDNPHAIVTISSELFKFEDVID